MITLDRFTADNVQMPHNSRPCAATACMFQAQRKKARGKKKDQRAGCHLIHAPPPTQPLPIHPLQSEFRSDFCSRLVLVWIMGSAFLQKSHILLSLISRVAGRHAFSAGIRQQPIADKTRIPILTRLVVHYCSLPYGAFVYLLRRVGPCRILCYHYPRCTRAIRSIGSSSHNRTSGRIITGASVGWLGPVSIEIGRGQLTRLSLCLCAKGGREGEKPDHA